MLIDIYIYTYIYIFYVYVELLIPGNAPASRTSKDQRIYENENIMGIYCGE